MWDADSLLLIGEIFIDLCCLLRQKDRKTVACREYEIISSSLAAPGTGLTAHHDSRTLFGKLVVCCSGFDCKGVLVMDRLVSVECIFYCCECGFPIQFTGLGFVCSNTCEFSFLYHCYHQLFSTQVLTAASVWFSRFSYVRLSVTHCVPRHSTRQYDIAIVLVHKLTTLLQLFVVACTDCDDQYWQRGQRCSVPHVGPCHRVRTRSDNQSALFSVRCTPAITHRCWIHTAT